MSGHYEYSDWTGDDVWVEDPPAAKVAPAAPVVATPVAATPPAGHNIPTQKLGLFILGMLIMAGVMIVVLLERAKQLATTRLIQKQK